MNEQLEVTETIYSDYIITRDGRPYAGPFASRGDAEGMIGSLSPLLGRRAPAVDSDEGLSVCDLIHAA